MYTSIYDYNLLNIKSQGINMISNLKKFIAIAVLSACFVVLSIFGTINLFELKITSQNLPLYVGAMSYGMIPGALIGLLGMLTSQMVTYGFTGTTLFWVLPYVIIGSIVGEVFEKNIIKEKSKVRFYAFIIFMQLLLTLLNTVAMVADSIVYGYYNLYLIFGSLLIRVMVSVITGIIYATVLPVIINSIKKIR